MPRSGAPTRKRATQSAATQSSATHSAAKLRRTLQSTFGLDTFRPGQREIIASILAGRDTLAVMPTGAGKSLCYQLPALHLPGMTLVISPLISLMKDQADKLRERGIKVAVLNSALNSDETRAALDDIARERAEFVITTPERLADQLFVDELAGKIFDLFVIDEAHCVSQWGHDFRPAYLAIGPALRTLGRRPILALTATAPVEIAEDIVRQLGLEHVNIINTGIFRPNLRYAVVHTPTDEDKLRELGRWLARESGAGIIYCATVKQVDTVTEHLRSAGFPVAAYHGRLGARERHETQDRFMSGGVDVIVATNAFGMGIDRPDIRFVFHYSMPGTLEAYYQESGRAGRDGEPADCVLLYQKNDRNTQQFFLGGRYPTFNDLLAVHEAIARLNAASQLSSVAAVRDELPVMSSAKVRVAIALMREAGLLKERRRAGYVLRRRLGEPEILALASEYENRREQDRRKLDQMVMFAQTARCRWRVLLEYFGEDVPFETCGDCDVCERESAPAVPPETAGPLEMTIGARVETPSSGEGEVVEILGDTVTVRCEDGARRVFPRSLLTA